MVRCDKHRRLVPSARCLHRPADLAQSPVQEGQAVEVTANGRVFQCELSRSTVIRMGRMGNRKVNERETVLHVVGDLQPLLQNRLIGLHLLPHRERLAERREKCGLKEAARLSWKRLAERVTHTVVLDWHLPGIAKCEAAQYPARRMKPLH